MTENTTKTSQPVTIFETQEMTAEEITKQNNNFAAMGVGIVVVDVSKFCGKMELQADGTYKRVTLRRKKSKS